MSTAREKAKTGSFELKYKRKNGETSTTKNYQEKAEVFANFIQQCVFH
jgi:hypothetical protein